MDEIDTANLLRWRERFKDRFELIAERYPPRIDVDLEALADMLTALIDGSIILSRIVREKHALPRQVELYRQFVSTVFHGKA